MPGWPSASVAQPEPVRFDTTSFQDPCHGVPVCENVSFCVPDATIRCGHEPSKQAIGGSAAVEGTFMSTSAPDMVDVAVCVVGAGPVGATLACLLGSAGIPVAVVDRAALPPDGASRLRRPRLCDRVRQPPAAGAGRGVAPPAAAVRADRGHTGVGRPARPPGLAVVPALRPSRGRRTVRLDDGSAQPARGAERGAAREPRDPGRRPSTGDGAQARRGGHGGADKRRPHRARPAAGRRRRARQPVAAAGRHRGDAAALQPDRAGVRGGARPAPPQPGAGALPARRPVRAAADGRHRGRAAPVGDRVDRARRVGGPAAGPARTTRSGARSSDGWAITSAACARSAGAGATG